MAEPGVSNAWLGKGLPLAAQRGGEIVGGWTCSALPNSSGEAEGPGFPCKLFGKFLAEKELSGPGEDYESIVLGTASCLWCQLGAHNTRH